MSEDIYDCQNWDNTSGLWWVEARGVAKHPTMLRTVSTTNKHLSPMAIVPALRNLAVNPSPYKWSIIAFILKISNGSTSCQTTSSHMQE